MSHCIEVPTGTITASAPPQDEVVAVHVFVVAPCFEYVEQQPQVERQAGVANHVISGYLSKTVLALFDAFAIRASTKGSARAPLSFAE